METILLSIACVSLLLIALSQTKQTIDRIWKGKKKKPVRKVKAVAKRKPARRQKGQPGPSKKPGRSDTKKRLIELIEKL